MTNVLRPALVAAIVAAGLVPNAFVAAGTADLAATARGAPDAETVVAEFDVASSPTPIHVEVLPLVRTPAGLVLTLDATSADGRVTYLLATAARSGSLAFTAWWVGLRLVDTVGDRVASPALDGEGDAVVSSPGLPSNDAEARIQLLFADPGVDQLAVFVPQGGLVTGIPVIDGSTPALPDGQEPLDPSLAVGPRVVPMVGFSTDLATTTRTETTTDALTLSLGSDVLFDTDSAELTPAAVAVIQAAAVELQSRSPGEVQVVGHTDDRGDEPYNQDLSERRAAAVAASLTTMIDTASYPLAVSGRGETEPVADNSTTAGKAANRRVELILAAPAVTTVEETTTLPSPPALTATGAAGVPIELARPYQVTAPRARVVDGHLVVDLTVTARDEEVGSAFGPALFDGSIVIAPTQPLIRQRTMAGVMLLDGSVAVAPVLHEVLDDGSMIPLTDLATYNRLDGGQSRTSVLVYPRGVTVGATVTLQGLGDDGDDAWRLTDIPVEP